LAETKLKKFGTSSGNSDYCLLYVASLLRNMTPIFI